MIITISNNISLSIAELGPDLTNAIKARLFFKNKAYGEALGRARARGRPTMNPRDSDGKPIPQFISQWHEQAGQLVIPRGIASDLITMLAEAGARAQVQDLTRRLPEVGFQFLKKRRPYQTEATDAVLARRLGVLICPTGGGKTTMGAYLIAARRQPTCIVVHTNKLVRQWAERLAGSADHDPQLDVTHDEIGYIADGKVGIGRRVTIALIQTLTKVIHDVRHHFGHFMFDECHHCPARTFDQVAAACDSYFMTGLTATWKRSDGKHPLMFWNVGPIVHEVSYSRLVSEGWILLPVPVIHETKFKSSIDAFNIPAYDYMNMDDKAKTAVQVERQEQKANLITELVTDPGRNAQIVNDVAAVLTTGGGPCLILSDRTDHCDLLGGMLNDAGIPTSVSHGKLKRKDQNKAEMALRHGSAKVLVATGQLLGEGFDEAVPSDLFLVTPISFSERLKQYLGRIGRPAEDKAAVVHDYQDPECESLMKSARDRIRTYRSLAKLAQGPTRRK